LVDEIILYYDARSKNFKLHFFGNLVATYFILKKYVLHAQVCPPGEILEVTLWHGCQWYAVANLI